MTVKNETRERVKVTCVSCGKQRFPVSGQPVCKACWKKWYYRCELKCANHSVVNFDGNEYDDHCTVLGTLGDAGAVGIMQRKNCGSFKPTSLKERRYWFVFAFKEMFGIP